VKPKQFFLELVGVSILGFYMGFVPKVSDIIERSVTKSDPWWLRGTVDIATMLATFSLYFLGYKVALWLYNTFVEINITPFRVISRSIVYGSILALSMVLSDLWRYGGNKGGSVWAKIITGIIVWTVVELVIKRRVLRAVKG